MPEEAPVISAVLRAVSVMRVPSGLDDGRHPFVVIDGDRHISLSRRVGSKGTAVRVTREKAAENRARIVAKAAQLFREKGFAAVGVDAIMEAAGLTHGGFYRHFRSKEDLAAEAVAHGLAISAERQAGEASLEAYVASYLSPSHRDNPGAGCVIAALAGDMARQGPGIRDRLTAQIPTSLDGLAARIGAEDPVGAREQAIATLAGMVGALVLARAVNDPALSDEILATARKAFGTAKATGASADP